MSVLVLFLFATFVGAKSYSSRSSYSSSRSSYSSSSSKSYSSPSWSNRSSSKSSYSSRSTSSPKKSTSGYSSKSTYSTPKTKSNYSSRSTSSPKKSSSTYSSSSTLTPKTKSNYSSRSNSYSSKPVIKKSAAEKKIERNVQKKQSGNALASYKEKQKQYKQPAKKIDFKSNESRINKIRGSSRNTSTPYITRRDNFYKSNRYVRPDYYNRYCAPRYGLFDTLALAYMMDNLDNPANALFFYGHRADPSVMLFLAAMNNNKEEKEVNQKMKDLEMKVSNLEKQNTKVDPDYVPPAMSDLVLAPEAVKAIAPAELGERPVLRFGTAGRTGNYFKFGQIFKKEVKDDIDIKLEETRGSYHNLQLLKTGKIDAALVQSDTFKLYQKEFTSLQTIQGTMYPEYVHLIVNRKSNINSIKDLIPGKHKVLIGGNGSGSETTWKSFCDEDNFYLKFDTKNLGGKSGLLEVVNNSNSVMIFVCGLNSELLNIAKTYNKDLKLAHVDDWDFNDSVDQWGNDIYRFEDIPGGKYKGLQDGIIISSIETIAVDAVLVLSQKWAGTHGELGVDAFTDSIIKTKTIMNKIVN